MVKPAMRAKDVVDQLTKQHGEILQLVQELDSILDGAGNIDKAVRIKGLLDKLIEILDTHLKIEDKLLYPILIKSTNHKVKTTAAVFSEEMGSIAKELGLYLGKWTTSISIANGSEGFMKETKELISVLLKRIEREDNELFPLLLSPH